MASKSRARASKRTARRPRGRPGRVPAGSRLAQAGRRALVALRALPLALRVLVGAVVILVAWAVVNWGYRVIRKPTELFFPVSGALAKSPPETWRTYGPLFTAHATAVITLELLAALAQVENGGNPVARTYWRWRPTANPLALYQPASSAVGMYQITDGTFQEAKRYCIHYARVSRDEQNPELQWAAVKEAGCKRVVTDTMSGARTPSCHGPRPRQRQPGAPDRRRTTPPAKRAFPPAVSCCRDVRIASPGLVWQPCRCLCTRSATRSERPRVQVDPPPSG